MRNPAIEFLVFTAVKLPTRIYVPTASLKALKRKFFAKPHQLREHFFARKKDYDMCVCEHSATKTCHRKHNLTFKANIFTTRTLW